MACDQHVVSYGLVNMYRNEEIDVAANGRARRHRVIRPVVPTNGGANGRRQCRDGRRARSRVRCTVAFSCRLRGILTNLSSRAHRGRRRSRFAGRRVNARYNMNCRFRFVSRASGRGESGRQAADRAWFSQDQRAQGNGERASRGSATGGASGGDCSIQVIRAARLIARRIDRAFSNVLQAGCRRAITRLRTGLADNGRIRAQAISAYRVGSVRATRVGFSRHLSISVQLYRRGATERRQFILLIDNVPVLFSFQASRNRSDFQIVFHAGRRRAIARAGRHVNVQHGRIAILGGAHACGIAYRRILCL